MVWERGGGGLESLCVLTGKRISKQLFPTHYGPYALSTNVTCYVHFTTIHIQSEVYCNFDDQLDTLSLVCEWVDWLAPVRHQSKNKKKGGGSIPVTVIPSSALTFKYSRVFSFSFSLPPFFLPGFTWGQYPLNDRLACCMTSDGNKPGGGTR